MCLMLTTECQHKLFWPSPDPIVSNRCCFPSTQQKEFRLFSVVFARVAFLLAKAVTITQALYPMPPAANTEPESAWEVNVERFVVCLFLNIFPLYFGCSQLCFAPCSGTLAGALPCSM